jgi:hypothetical protein
MNRSFWLFILVALALVWSNEWSKVNVNYQLMMREKFSGFDAMTLEQKLAIKNYQSEIAPFAQIYAHSDWDWFYNQDVGFWKKMKWMIPVTFTFLFAFLEWWMLPKCFHQMQGHRKWIVIYYLGLIAVVVGLYSISVASGSLPIQNFTRKVWMILQSPSFFVLLLIDQWKRKYEN